MSNLRPFMSKCYQNVSFYVTKSATDSDGMNVRIRTAFALEKAFAPLAQLAEQLTLNQRVAGSIPARCTCYRPKRGLRPFQSS
jgi:hypothetical protein